MKIYFETTEQYYDLSSGDYDFVTTIDDKGDKHLLFDCYTDEIFIDGLKDCFSAYDFNDVSSDCVEVRTIVYLDGQSKADACLSLDSDQIAKLSETQKKSLENFASCDDDVEDYKALKEYITYSLYL